MNEHQVQFILQAIQEQKDLLSSEANASNDDKFNRLNNIVELKKLISYQGADSLYLDFKRFIEYYLKALDEKDSEYDQLSVSMVSDKISCLKLQDQISILRCFKRLLSVYGYHEFIDDCESEIQKLNLLFYLQNKSLENYLRLVITWSSMSLPNLISILLVFFLIAYVALLPAPYPSWSVFSLEPSVYSHNNHLNHFCNVLTLFFDIEEGLKVKGVNEVGIITIILSKIVYIIVLINYIVKKIIDALDFSK